MITFIKGFLDCLSGFSLLFKSGIKRYVLVPLIINITLFSLATKLLTEQLDVWLDRLLPNWLGWLEWLIWPLVAIAMLLIVFYSFTVVANLLAAPFNSLLSAKIEALLTGKKPTNILAESTGSESADSENTSSESFVKLTIRTLQSEIKKIFYAMKWFIPLVIITVIPVINIVAPFLWIVFAAWFFALEYSDYPLANRGQLFSEVKSYNQKNRMRSLGLGTAVFILTSIPVVNFFAMPIAVAGATKLTTKAKLYGH